VALVIADNSLDVILVDGRTVLHEGRETMVPIFQPLNYFSLVRQCCLRIRNDKSWHEGMCFTADTAADTVDTQADGTVRDFKGAGVISVDRKTGRVFTGASELVELETADEVIIFF